MHNAINIIQYISLMICDCGEIILLYTRILCLVILRTGRYERKLETFPLPGLIVLSENYS